MQLGTVTAPFYLLVTAKFSFAPFSAPVSGREVGCIFRSDGSRQDRGPKGASEGVRVDKIRLGPVDVNLQTEELHCDYSVLTGSPE